jgi:23S rRNA (guanosine2251-2'-O)-methyltransferase
MRKLTHEEIVARQVKYSRQPRIPLTIVLDNIRSLHNVGSVFRTADGIGVEKLWLCGITGYPPKGDISKTALGAEESVPWEFETNVLKPVELMKAADYEIVILEQVEGAISYEKYSPTRPVCLVIGNEVEGVSDEVIARCDQTIEIPMLGVKNSLNVAVACGVVGFYLRTRLMPLRRREFLLPQKSRVTKEII